MSPRRPVVTGKGDPPPTKPLPRDTPGTPALVSDKDVAWYYDRLAKVIVPKSDLEYGSAFELLVAVALSAHTTDRSVNAATAKLFPVANTPKALRALGVDGVLPYIRGVGLAPGKAARMMAMCDILIERHGGEVPRTREELEELPGVGHKTASVVLNIAFGEPTIAVDTHVHRVANRLGICRTTIPVRTELALLERTPKRHLQNAHHYLILHGRYTCIARAPKCAVCPLAERCPSRAFFALGPVAKKARPTTKKPVRPR